MTVEQFGLTRAATVDRGRLRAAIEDAFTELALHPSRGFHFVSGPELAGRVGYSEHLLRGVPEQALASFSGVGNPFRLGSPVVGEVVLDVGCGSGTDLVIASELVGPTGRALGVDMTSAMVERARECLLQARRANARVEWGHAEALPVRNATVDRVVCNGVLSLTPSKADVLREFARVLRPGGRLHVVDVVVDVVLDRRLALDPKLWTECIAGATRLETLLADLAAAGFERVETVETIDVFAGTRLAQEAEPHGARSASVRARKPRA